MKNGSLNIENMVSDHFTDTGLKREGMKLQQKIMSLIDWSKFGKEEMKFFAQSLTRAFDH